MRIRGISVTFILLRPAVFQVLCHTSSNNGWTLVKSTILHYFNLFLNLELKVKAFHFQTHPSENTFRHQSPAWSLGCLTSHPSLPSNIILLSLSCEGAGFGTEQKNMTYLAAAATVVGASAHNKNSQLSFVLGPRFLCNYTTFGCVNTGVEKVMIWKG